MNPQDRFWHGHLDLSKIGIVGHSMGGTTAALATREEPRILAGVNLDGSTYPGMNGDVRPIPVNKPFLFLATEEHAAGEARAREYIGSESNTYYVVVTGADHIFFPVFSHTYELYSLATIPNWRQRCRKAACFITEVWSDMLPEYLLELLSAFDHVFIGHRHPR